MSAPTSGLTCLDYSTFSQPKTSQSKLSVAMPSRLDNGRFRACLRIVSQLTVLLFARPLRDGASSSTPRCRLTSGSRTATRKNKSMPTSAPQTDLQPEEEERPPKCKWGRNARTRKPRRRWQKKKRDADFRSGQRKFLTVVVKQLLQTTQVCRDMQSIITEVLLIDSEALEQAFDALLCMRMDLVYVRQLDTRYQPGERNGTHSHRAEI